MIAYDLSCANGHVFEGWFDSAEAFEEQKAAGLVTCPVCNDGEVNRILSPVRSVSARSSAKETDEVDPAKALYKAVADYIKENFEDVGADFAKEALKIHYGVSPTRSIRGSSTSQEEEMLRAEGVQFFKFPIPKNLD